MKFLVLGAGQMGYAVVYDLIRSPNIDKVFLADNNPQQIKLVTDQLVDDRIVPCQLDVTNFEDVVQLMSGSDVAISCVTYIHNFELAKAALEAGTNFCDLGGNNDIVRKELLLDEFAKERGISIIPDCGLAPGLTSILTAAATEGMEEIYEIRIRDGGLPVEPQPPLNYSLVFSVEGLINEYIEEAIVIQDGKLIQVPSLTNLEEIEFPAPFGVLEAFTTSGGVSTLPATYAGRVQHLDSKTIRYPGHCAILRAMALLGLMGSEPVKVDSTNVSPRKLFATLLEQKLPRNEPDVVLLRITVSGIKNKQPIEVIWEGIDYMDQAAGLTAMMRMTAFPASIIAQMIARGDIKEKGALVQEKCIPTKIFLAEIASRGIRLSMLEREPVA
ncbi:MAG: saccharopine dehydrogenase NADP-binding domain-containing protein [Candidatus Melainabacteria bacterium]|nr:saccharopine dehydrogenase NADP-binding domain-containing protein [Candidatus Melainabacteria bacterium]